MFQQEILEQLHTLLIQQKISYSLMVFVRKRTMKVDGSKIIFGLGVTSAVGIAVIALYFSIR